MTKHPDICIIMPVYNESGMVGEVIKTIKKHFSNIICVNDGSRDNSAEVIQTSGATLLNHCVNLGAGAATQTGVDYALLDKNTKYFITIDADGQHDIEDAKRMVDYIKKHNVDIVFGSRFLGTVNNISPLKLKFLKLAGVYSGVASGLKLTDPHIGLRVFNRRFAESLQLTMPDFAHASELVNRVEEGKFLYAEVPASVTYTDYSKSKGQPMLNAINITFDLFFHRFTKK